MPKHMSIATVIDKNRIASTNSFITLAEIEVVNVDTGELEETIYLANNNEDIDYQGNTYTATSFDFEITETAEGVPDLNVVFKDPTGGVMQKAETHNGGVGWKVRFKIVNSGNLAQPAEIEEFVYIIGAKANDYSIEFTLGARNPLAQTFPRRIQWRDRCPWIFKSNECGYSGPVSTCDYTLQGPNGCAAKSNQKRFGGFPGIRPRT